MAISDEAGGGRHHSVVVSSNSQTRQFNNFLAIFSRLDSSVRKRVVIRNAEKTFGLMG